MKKRQKETNRRTVDDSHFECIISQEETKWKRSTEQSYWRSETQNYLWIYCQQEAENDIQIRNCPRVNGQLNSFRFYKFWLWIYFTVFELNKNANQKCRRSEKFIKIKSTLSNKINTNLCIQLERENVKIKCAQQMAEQTNDDLCERDKITTEEEKKLLAHSDDIDWPQRQSDKLIDRKCQKLKMSNQSNAISLFAFVYRWSW